MNRRLRVRQAAAGFTLIELLVVMTIIGMLAGMVLVALAAVRETARRDKTRSTIAKLKNIIEPLYDSYRTRRVPLSDGDLRSIAVSSFGLPAGQPVPPSLAAKIRVVALRDIMRMEMPERPNDVADPPLFFPVLRAPSVAQAYQRRAGTNLGNHGNGSAECLYMIVSVLGGEDARKQFGDDEVGDTDVDANGNPSPNGLPEFIDGWGKPIQFLRWAPGFVDSDVQMTMHFTDSSGNDIPPDPTNNTYLDLLCRSDHDPFDSRRIDIASKPGDPARGWRLVPLIYSAGPDGKYGLWVNVADPAKSYHWQNNTYDRIQDPDLGWVLMGQPFGDGYYDNIHSHRLEVP